MNKETPSSLEAEISVIGSILKDPEAIEIVFEKIDSPDYFTAPKHQIIFSGILSLYKKNEPIDITTMANELRASNKLESIGGSVYLAQLLEEVITIANLQFHCNILVEKYQLRSLIHTSTEIVKSCYAEALPVSELLNMAESQIYKLTTQRKPDYSTIADMTEPTMDHILAEKDNSRSRWIETRVSTLNNFVTGFFRGDYVVIAAPPSMGKTMFSLDTCVFNLQWGRSVFYVSLDQSEESIIYRMLTSLTGITKNDLLRGNFSESDRDKLAYAGAKLAGYGKFHITDTADLTVLDIRSQARKIKRKVGLDILVIDYIQMIPPHGKFGNRNLELTEISRVLKQIAKELDCVVLVLSQLSRDYSKTNIDPATNQWGFPQIWMLRESGAIEQDANMIIFPWVPYELMKKKYGEQSYEFKNFLHNYPHLQNLSYMVVAKNKDGETGVVECARDAQRMRFYTEQKYEQ